MEKPDANGCVNINWPSKNIPHGGIFHTRVVNKSIEQQQYLKLLLEESKLSIAQRKKSTLSLRENESTTERRPQVQIPMVRPRTSRRRSLSAIRESGAFEFVPYLPQKRGEDREKLKQKLANFMAYGDTLEKPSPPPPLVARAAKPAPKPLTNKEIWHDLVTQIRERADWLAEMEYLGEAGPHREIINNQIAERMRSLDALGIDSECPTARSSASGFSTLRSREIIDNNDTANRATVGSGRSIQSKKSQGKMKPVSGMARKKSSKEENVSAYSQLSPLQYSPRRRV